VIDDEKPGPRRIDFGDGPSLGEVSIRDWGAPGYGGWKVLGEARGAFAVPAGKEAMLKVHWSASTELRQLARLRPDDLQWLDCRDTQVGDAQCRNIAHLTGLHDLGLGHTAVGDAAMRHIEGFHNLRELYLPGTKITDVGMRSIGRLEALRALALNDTSVTDAGIALLARLARLRRLWLKGTAVTDAAIPHLTKIETLARMDLRSTKITATGIEALRKALPRCFVVT
jgi:hypothetical protein